MSQLVLFQKSYNFANYITNAFGQFDNYTPMQLAQYVGTIANNGVRIAPHIVEGIYGNNEQGGLGDLIQSVESKEMNKINISESDVSILQQGFYQVSHGGSALTTGRAFSMVQLYRLAGKQVPPKVMLREVKKPTTPMPWPMHHQIIRTPLLAMVPTYWANCIGV